MALNEVFRHGDRISLPVGAGVKSGDPVIVGELVGWAQTDAAATPPVTGRSTIKTSNADGWASVSLVGAFKAPVVAAAAAAVGVRIFIDPATRALSVAGGGATKPFGHLLTPISGAGTVSAVVRVQNGIGA